MAITRRSSSKPSTEEATTLAQNTNAGPSAANTVSDYIKERDTRLALEAQKEAIRKAAWDKAVAEGKAAAAKAKIKDDARAAVEKKIKDNFLNTPAGKSYVDRDKWYLTNKINTYNSGDRKAWYLSTEDGQAIQRHLKDQLLNQSKAYGFDWKTTIDADRNASQVANLLALQGVSDIRDLTYDKNGNLQNNQYVKLDDLIDSKLDNKPIKVESTPIKWYKDDKGQIGWTAAGKGRTNYMVKPDANGNPVFHPDWKSNAPGGIGGFILKAAPAVVGIATGNPWLAAATSAGIGAASGASLDDIIKGAVLTGGTSYLGGLANASTQGALSGLDSSVKAALGGAAQGATQAGVAGAVTGNFNLKDVATSALAGGAASGIKSLLTDQLPAGQQGPVQPKDITGIAAVDKILPGAAANLTGQVVAGRDLGDALTNTAIGAVSNLAAGQVGGALSGVTGNPELDKFLASAGANLTGTALATFLREQAASTPNRPSAPARPATATTTAAAPNAVKPTATTAASTPAATTATAQPVTTAPTTTTAAPTVNAAVNTPTTTAPTTATTAVNGNNNLLNYLSLAGMLGGGQSGGTTSAPVLANVKPMDLGWLTPTVNRLYPKKVA